MISFYKLHGAGNDFIFIYDPNKKIKNRKKLVPQFCNRNFGIGADGVVFIQKSKNKNVNFEWDFYNSDGSSAEACMNATRCAILFYFLVFKKKTCAFKTLSGVISGRVLKKQKNKIFSVEIEVPDKNYEIQKKIISTSYGQVNGYFVNTGVPHFVVLNETLNIKNELDEAFKKRALEIQIHKEFSPQQTNVTYLNKDPQPNQAVTFERGVRGFTLACGTGALAAAQVLSTLELKSTIEIQMPGGNLKFYTKNKKSFLSGPAVLVYKGSI